MEARLAADLSLLSEAVARTEQEVNSAVVLLSNLHDAIADTVDAAELNAIIARLNASSTLLAQAVIQNTP